MYETTAFRLGDVTINHDARRIPVRAADRTPGSIPYYGASGVVDYVDDYIFEGDYLLIAEDGENLRTRKTPIAFMATGKFWVNNHAHIVTGNEYANTRYLCYVLARLDISGFLSGSTQPKLTQAALKSIPVRLPARKYQDAVIEVLEALEKKISLNDCTAVAYERMLSTRFEGLEIDVESSEVHRVPVTELVEFNPPLPLPKAVAEAVYLEMASIPTSTARVQSWTKRVPKSGTRFQNGDTVMARITPCLENGKTAYIDFMEPGEVGIGSTEFIVMRACAGIPVHLPYFLARSPRFRTHAIRNMVGSSGRQRVGAQSLAQVTVNQPDVRLMALFGEEAASAFAHMKSLDDESRNLRALRDTLLPGLMSGAIRVRDAEKVVEDAV